MRLTLMTAAGAALILAPAYALAQSDTAAPSGASGLKGPPNANGYGDTASQAKTDAGSDSGDKASGQKMKGSPNADGYRK